MSLAVRWLLLLVGGLAVGGAIAAQPDSLDRRLERANEAYTQGRYTRAADLYEEVLEVGYASGALYYNLGNAYVRLDRLGPAIRYYEKARRLRPDDPRLRHNLEQARRRAGVYPERLDDAPPRGLTDLVRGWSPPALYVGGALLLCGGLFVAVLWARPGRTGEWRHPLVWGAVLGGLLFAAASLGTSYLQSRTRRAVVVVDRVELRRTPSAEAPSDTTLPEGVMVEVRTQQARWHAVRLADGTTGWVPGRALGEI